jgi:hypothetical protein
MHTNTSVSYRPSFQAQASKNLSRLFPDAQEIVEGLGDKNTVVDILDNLNDIYHTGDAARSLGHRKSNKEKVYTLGIYNKIFGETQIFQPLFTDVKGTAKEVRYSAADAALLLYKLDKDSIYQAENNLFEKAKKVPNIEQRMLECQKNGIYLDPKTEKLFYKA